MAKKKKETCEYCGKSFAYLSRHKCRIKDKVEGVEEDDKSDAERRTERIEETKKTLHRNLKKDEKTILSLINEKRDLFFYDLIELTGKKRNELEEILELLVLQSKIKLKRELVDATWTKHITALEDYEELNVKDVQVDLSKKDYIWDLFAHQPCFICPFSEKCNDTNLDQFNPYYCIWLSNWVEGNLKGQDYRVDFDGFREENPEY